jgi:hypothetical protein
MFASVFCAFLAGCMSATNTPNQTPRQFSDAELIQVLNKELQDPAKWPTALKVEGRDGYVVFASNRELEHGLKPLLDSGVATMKDAHVVLTDKATSDVILANAELKGWLETRAALLPAPIALAPPATNKTTPVVTPRVVATPTPTPTPVATPTPTPAATATATAIATLTPKKEAVIEQPLPTATAPTTTSKTNWWLAVPIGIALFGLAVFAVWHLGRWLRRQFRRITNPLSPTNRELILLLVLRLGRRLRGWYRGRKKKATTSPTTTEAEPDKSGPPSILNLKLRGGGSRRWRNRRGTLAEPPTDPPDPSNPPADPK